MPSLFVCASPIPTDTRQYLTCIGNGKITQFLRPKVEKETAQCNFVNKSIKLDYRELFLTYFKNATELWSRLSTMTKYCHQVSGVLVTRKHGPF